MPFKTKLDFSSNRQVKQHTETFTELSGGTIFGVPFSALTTGPNTNVTGITETYNLINSSFSGNNTTTIFTWYDPRMSLGEPYITPITSATSANTPTIGPVYTASSSTVIDGNLVNLSYSGVMFDFVVVTADNLGGGDYSGTLLTNTFNVLTADTLDFTGRTIWNDVKGFTRTQELIITSNPIINYVWTCVDTEGKGQWLPSSGGTSGGTSYWSASTGTNAIVVNNSDSSANGILALAEGIQTTAAGNYSHAEGGGTIASGALSHAEGYLTQANGQAAHAEGKQTAALGVHSHAEGSGTTATGDASYSHAEGWGCIVLSDASHVEGYFTRASGDYGSHAEGSGSTASSFASHAEGEGTYAAAKAAHAEGNATIANGIYSHAQGSGSTASGNNSHAEGDITAAIGDASHAEGWMTQAFGQASHSEGYGTTAFGQYSHAEGYASKAMGDWSHAEGLTTTASGFIAHSEGNASIASGNFSHAQNSGTRATAQDSHAEGQNTTASGGWSHAEGAGSIASGGGSHAQGQFTQATNSGSHAEGDVTLSSGLASHAEGSGTTASGRVAHSEGQGTIASGNYSHAGGLQSTASGQASFVHGTGSTATGITTIVLGNNINGSADNSVYVPDLYITNLVTTDPLATNGSGKVIAGVSDGRLKENIQSIGSTLELVNQLRPVSFNYKPELELGTATHFGLIAQEVQPLFPELVKPRPGDEEHYNVSYIEMIPILINAIKELSSGVTSYNNTHLETQSILAEDNDIQLNYSGNQQTSIGGGIRVLHALGQDQEAEFITDENGNWVTNNDIKALALTIPLYTPTSSNDNAGSEGNITRDDDYIYIKTKNGWKRSNLESF